MAIIQCAHSGSGRMQDLPVPDGRHSMAAAVALSLHQQVCHSTGKQRGGGAGGQRKEEKQERIRQDAELHVKNKGERKIKDGNAKRALGICS